MGISTHILDTALGRPAVNVAVSLARVGEERTLLNEAVTDLDGRCKALLPENEPMTPGWYSVYFDTASYYVSVGMAGLYPFVEITFVVEEGQAHYHIPLLLTANGYTTYRGS